MSKPKECPTCGSDTPGYRCDNSAYDATVDIVGAITKRADSLSETSFDRVKKLWYCGPCPDAWHDTERRSGKDRREKTKAASSQES
jgi:hypothetical protein